MLLAWDAAIFRAIHHGMHVRALDPIMMWLTAPGAFRYVFFALAGAAFLARGARGALALAVLVATIAVSDQVSAKGIKPIFRRQRPSVELVDTRPLFGVRHSWSFPSNHAVNFTAAIPIVAAVFPAATVPAVVVAAAVSFSRIYVGDHWPSDVLGGILLGLYIGLLGRKALRRLERTVFGSPERGSMIHDAEPRIPEPLAPVTTGAGGGSSGGR